MLILNFFCFVLHKLTNIIKVTDYINKEHIAYRIHVFHCMFELATPIISLLTYNRINAF